MPRYCYLAEFSYLPWCIWIEDYCMLKFMFRVKFVVVGPVVCYTTSYFFEDSLSIFLALDNFFLLLEGDTTLSFWTTVVWIVLIGSPFNLTVIPWGFTAFCSLSFQLPSVSKGFGTYSKAWDFLWDFDCFGTEADACFLFPLTSSDTCILLGGGPYSEPSCWW